MTTGISHRCTAQSTLQVHRRISPFSGWPAIGTRLAPSILGTFQARDQPFQARPSIRDPEALPECPRMPRWHHSGGQTFSGPLACTQVMLIAMGHAKGWGLATSLPQRTGWGYDRYRSRTVYSIFTVSVLADITLKSR